MQLYNILIPMFSNRGQTMARLHQRFETELLDEAGGYTVSDQGVRGVWRDGHVFNDDLKSYIVAVPFPTLRLILAKAHSLFGDQEAIYVSEVGTYGLSYKGSTDIVGQTLPAPRDMDPADEAPPRDRGPGSPLADAYPRDGFPVKKAPASSHDMMDGWYDAEQSEALRPAGDVVGPYTPVVVIPKGDAAFDLTGDYREVVDPLPRETTDALSRVVAAERAKLEDPDTQLLARAEHVGQILRRSSCKWGMMAWGLDTAASMLRKAKHGYRANPAMGDAPWDLDVYRSKLATVLEDAQGVAGID